MNGVIKVADFGLAEDIYTRNYYRRGKGDTSAKLPVRWMSPESIEDGIFTEKSDVVRLHSWTVNIILCTRASLTSLAQLLPPCSPT